MLIKSLNICLIGATFTLALMMTQTLTLIMFQHEGVGVPSMPPPHLRMPLTAPTTQATVPDRLPRTSELPALSSQYSGRKHNKHQPTR